MEEYDKRIFATNLNHYLNLNHKKQADICDILHVSKSTVSSWCSAQKMPRMDKIEILANYFGVLKSDLIEEKPTPTFKSELASEIAELIDHLTPEQQKLILAQIRGILSNRE